MALSSAATLAVVAALAAPQAMADPGGTSGDARGAAAAATSAPAVQERTSAKTAEQKARQYFDSRRQGSSASVLQRRATSTAAKPPSAVVELKRQLGAQGLVSIDPLTGSPRQVAKVNGFLTGRSKASPRTIALRYVKANKGTFGLSRSALRSLKLRRDYVDVTGTHHLSFVQVAKGIPVFGNGLIAHVAKDGRIVGFTGSPLTSMAGMPGARPTVSATAARAAAIKDAGGRAESSSAKRLAGARTETRFADGDRASLVWFRTTGGTRLAWQTQVAPASGQLYTSVVDAASGRVLYRNSLVDNDTALIWETWPGAARGGVQQRRTLPQRWLPNGSVVLQGPNTHVFTDVDDNNAASTTEEVRPSSPNRFEYPFTPFAASSPGMPCSPRFQCSWDPNTPNSWRTNARQDAVQVFWYVNKFHDHLARTPSTPSRSTGRTPRAACPTPTTWTTPTCRRRRTVRRRPCRCTCSTSPARPTAPRRARTRSSPRTAVTRPTSSTTSTRTACPTGSWWTPTATRRWATSRPVRWARPGATGTRWTT
jgi:hypothetical protein